MAAAAVTTFEVLTFENGLANSIPNFRALNVDLTAVNPIEQFKFILHYSLRTQVVAYMKMDRTQLLALTITRGNVTKPLSDFINDTPMFYIDFLHTKGTVPGTDSGSEDQNPLMGRQVGLAAFAHGLANKGAAISQDDSDKLAALTLLGWLSLTEEQREAAKESYFSYIEGDNVSKHARKREFVAQPLKHWMTAMRFYKALGIHQQWVDALTRKESQTIGKMEADLLSKNREFSPVEDPMGNGYDKWLAEHRHLEPALATIMGVLSRVRNAPGMKKMKFLGRDQNDVHFNLAYTLSARIIEKIGEAIDTLEIFEIN